MHHPRNQAAEPTGHLERAVYHCVCSAYDPSCLPQPAWGKHQEHKFRSEIRVQSVRPTWFEDFAVPKSSCCRRHPPRPLTVLSSLQRLKNVPPQTGTLAQRALEEWERTL